MTAQTRWIKFSAYFLVVILVNIAAATLFFRIDLTSHRVFSLSSASRTAVSTLEEPLTIKAYFSDNLPSPYNNLEQEVSDLLEEYSLKANKFFNYGIENIQAEGTGESEKSRAARTAAQSYGIYPIQIQSVESNEVKLVSAFMGLVLIQGDVIETIPVLSNASNLEFQITSTIQKMNAKTGALLALEDNIRIKLYFSSSLEKAGADRQGYSQDVMSVVEEMNRQNYGRLEYVLVDPDNLSAGDIPPEDYNLPLVKLQTGTNLNPQISEVYASLVVVSGEKYGSMNLLNRGVFGYQIEDPQKIKESLGGVIDKMTGMNPRVGYLADHGTPPLYGDESGRQIQGSPELNNFRTLVGSSYDLVQVDLGAAGIPDDIQSLLVVSPSVPFTPWEQYQLDQFIMKGNSVIFMLDTMTEIYPQGNQGYGQQPVYIPRETGLQEMLAHYGFSLSPSYILDEKCFTQTSRQNDGGLIEIPLYFAPLIDGKFIDQTSPMLGNIKGLILLNTSPLILSEAPASGTPPKALVRSSGTSWEMKENINLYNPLAIMPPGAEARKSQIAAALADGSMTSFFKGKNVPPAPEPAASPEGSAEEPSMLLDIQAGRTESRTIESSPRGRIFVTGSSYLLMDNTLDARGVTPNSTFVQNMMDTMNGREDYALMRSKGQTYNPLDETSGAAKTFIKGFNIAGLPLVVILFGVLVWLRWISRKKKIESLFVEKTNE